MRTVVYVRVSDAASKGPETIEQQLDRLRACFRSPRRGRLAGIKKRTFSGMMATAEQR